MSFVYEQYVTSGTTITLRNGRKEFLPNGSYVKVIEVHNLPKDHGLEIDEKFDLVVFSKYGLGVIDKYIINDYEQRRLLHQV
jgi:hypothetical protein